MHYTLVCSSFFVRKRSLTENKIPLLQINWNDYDDTGHGYRRGTLQLVSCIFIVDTRYMEMVGGMYYGL